MVYGQFHLVHIEIYELERDYFRVENKAWDEWSRKQTSSGKIEKLTSYKAA